MSNVVKTSAEQRRPQRIICILGMHRSGTSCLTGSLQEAGLELGDCHTWNPYNLKGNRENQQIVDINDSILKDNGGSWDNPPRRLSWRNEHLFAARVLFERYADARCFGFKDPRTLLTLQGWVELFPDMDFVGIFRHPEAVAQSLVKRSEMPRDAGLELWYQYNKRLYNQLRHKRFPLLCFDEDSSVFQEKLRKVLEEKQLDTQAWQGEFYDEALRSPVTSEHKSLPWKVRRLYRRLRHLAE